MKSVVLNDIGRQVEFKPNVLFDKYFRLVEIDVTRKFKNKRLISSNCPACHSKKKIKAFKKFGFQYVECLNCNTVYATPHPRDEDIKYHFLSSESSRFWRENLSKTTSDARKEKIYSPRLEWMANMIEEYYPQGKNVADLCNRNKEYVADFLRSSYFENKIIVNPYYNIVAKSHDMGGVQVIDSLDKARKNKETIDVVSAFEVIDYTVDIDGFFKAIKDMLIRGGLCFLTTISISGFDLQVLWNNSKSIFPLDRINVLSNKGLNLLFKRHNLEILEYSTPGLLDLDIVKNAIQGDKKVSVPRFVRTLIEQGDEQLYKDFQEFLQINRLSSFTRILLRKN